MLTVDIFILGENVGMIETSASHLCFALVLLLLIQEKSLIILG